MTDLITLGNHVIININGQIFEHRITKITKYGIMLYKGHDISIFFDIHKKELAIPNFKNIKIDFEKVKEPWIPMPKILLNDYVQTRTYDINEAPINVGIHTQLIKVNESLKLSNPVIIANATLTQFQQQYGKDIMPDLAIQLFSTTPIIFETIRLLKMFEPFNNSHDLQIKFQEVFKLNYAFIMTIPDKDWDAIYNFYHLVKNMIFTT